MGIGPNTGASAGNGGGGSGFALGPEQNEFATNAARDTYATANAAWLTLYNAERLNWIEIGGATIQRRNAAGNAWENVTAAIRGPAGAASTVPGPAGAEGAASMVPGPAGPASTVPGPIGPTGAPGTPGGTGTTTPPTTIVNAIAYTQHGAVTVGSWRDYDVLQFIFDNGNYYPAVPITTAALRLANSVATQALLSFEQNTSLNAYSTDDSDDITISFHNSGPPFNTNSSMTVLGWFAGSKGIPGPVGPPGAGSTILAADESVDLPNPITKINAVGAGIVATEIGGVLTLTVAGGGGGTPVQTHTEQYLAGKATQNFESGRFHRRSGHCLS